MSNRSRREFLITTGTGLAAASLLVPGEAHAGRPASFRQALRTRKNVTSPAAKNDLASLSKGVAEMRKLVTTAPKDPRGWVLQSFIHGNCTQFTKCQHGSWFFAPWHRSFIYYFEQLIQHFSGDPKFALPYWDWSRTTSVPGTFYGTGNPLNDILSIRSSSCPSAPTVGRGRSATEKFSTSDLATYVGSTVINTMQDNSDFDTYGGGGPSNPGTGELEWRPHNFVHRWVGGTKFSNMVQTFSPLDPIFWLHHCNIDRLYSNWLSRPQHVPPSDAAWQKKSFQDFFDKDGKPAGSEFTCGQTVDSTVMNYTYDEVLELPDILTNVKLTGPVKVEVVASVAATKATRQGNVLAFVSDAAPSPDTRKFMNAAALRAGSYIARLRIEGVKSPAQQNTAVHVFLGSGITVDTPTSAPGYAGSFTFFDGLGGASEASHEHSTRNVLINVSDTLKRLYGDTSLPAGANVTVSLVTRPLYTGVSAFATVEQVQPDRVQLDVVNLRA
jgi:tyrosinase